MVGLQVRRATSLPVALVLFCALVGCSGHGAKHTAKDTGDAGLPGSKDGGSDTSDAGATMPCPEHAYAHSPVRGRPYGGASHPVLTHGDQGSLLVWEDTRRGHRGLYATAVSEDGKLLDPTGTFLTDYEPFEDASAPLVAFGGGVYLVVFVGSDIQPYDGWDSVQALRVDASGKKLDQQSLTINGSFHGDVVFNGKEFVLAASDYEFGGLFRISTDGNILRNGEPVEEVEEISGEKPSNNIWTSAARIIAGKGGQSLLLATTDDGLKAVPLDAELKALNIDGVLLKGVGVTASQGEELAIATAFNGKHYLLAWSEMGTGKTLAMRLNLDGTMVDKTPVVVESDREPDPDLFPLGANLSLTTSGSDFLLASDAQAPRVEAISQYNVRILRLKDGSVLEISEPTLVAAKAEGLHHSIGMPTLVPGANGSALVAWLNVFADSEYTGEDSIDTFELKLARVDAKGKISPLALPTAAPIQARPELSSAGKQDFAFWWERRGTDPFALVMQPLATDGSAKGEATTLTAAKSPGEVDYNKLGDVTMLAGPSSVAVLSGDEALLVHADGSVSDSISTESAFAGSIAQLEGAPEGDEFVVVGLSNTSATSGLSAQRLSKNGFIGKEILVADQQTYPSIGAFSVACQAGSCFIAWASEGEWKNVAAHHKERISYRILSKDGTLSAAQTFELRKGEQHPVASDVRVAASGSEFALVWSSSWNSDMGEQRVVEAASFSLAGKQLVAPHTLSPLFRSHSFFDLTPYSADDNLSLVATKDGYALGLTDDQDRIIVQELGHDLTPKGAVRTLARGDLGYHFVALHAADDGALSAVFTAFDAKLGAERVVHQRLVDGCGLR